LEDDVRALTPQLDEIAFCFVIEALKQLGIEWQVGASFTSADIALRVPARHRPKVAHMLKRLAGRGFLDASDHAYHVKRRQPKATALALLAAFESEHPGPECDFLRRAGTALASIWHGDVEPLTILFPDGATDKAAQFYSESHLLTQYNRLASEVMREIVESLPAGERLRILEVGAGTGGLTKHLLPRLPEDQTEYVFTDLSPLFLRGAEATFRDFPFLQTEVLDISKPLDAQDKKIGSFDVVVAANVLHATPRLRETLSHVRQLLKPRGWLVLLECFNPPLWGDMLFTLIDGWWLFEDRELRCNYPLLPPDGWRRVFAEAEFAEVACLHDARMKDASHHNLYLAQSGAALPRIGEVAAETNDAHGTAANASPAAAITMPQAALKTSHGDVATDDKQTLLELIRQRAAAVMRLDPELIEPCQPLSELGMDSLMAIELRSHLGDALGYELSLNPLRMRRSVEEIVEFVIEDRAAPAPYQQAEDTSLSNLELDVPRVHLVPLQPHGHKTPLFFVPAGYGDLLAFHDVGSALGADQPVYGLQPASAKQVKAVRQMSIYRLVSAYISEMRQVQPQGPYQIAGYSVEAIVAIEAARELIRQGDEVSLLVIFDPPSHIPFWLDWFYAANYWVCAHTGIVHFVRRFRSRLVRRLFHTVLDEGLRTHTTVAREHRVAPYPGRITYFRAMYSQGSLVSLKPIGRFWRKTAQGGIEVHWIPGTHYGMLRGPGAGVVVDELSDCLSRANTRNTT